MRLSRDHGTIMNHKKIIRIKNKYGLVTKIRKINPYRAIMKKTQEHRTCENGLSRQFKQIIPDKVFCTDITYLQFNHRVAYLSVVKDIASREVVGWNLSMHPTMELVFDTIKDMKNNIQSLKGSLLHSDQGFHYTNPRYIKMIKDLNIVQSMSRKGNCIDNSPMESFFGHLKDDIDYRSCKTFEELNLLVGEYIEYYNNKRYQWELKKMTPVEYRSHLLIAH